MSFVDSVSEWERRATAKSALEGLIQRQSYQKKRCRSDKGDDAQQHLGIAELAAEPRKYTEEERKQKSCRLIAITQAKLEAYQQQAR